MIRTIARSVWAHFGLPTTISTIYPRLLVVYLVLVKIQYRTITAVLWTVLCVRVKVKEREAVSGRCVVDAGQVEVRGSMTGRVCPCSSPLTWQL